MNSIILNEAYYGKNKTLAEIEKLFFKISEDLKENLNPNKDDKIIKDIEYKIAYLFGFEKVTFSILMVDSGLNAFTTSFFYNENHTADDNFYDLIRSKEGGIKFKDSKGKSLYIYVYSYCFRNCTPDNIMAILLHEIGHNFFLVKEQVHNSKNKLVSDFVYQCLLYLKNNGYSHDALIDVCNALISMALNLNKGISKSSYESYKKLMTDKAMKKSKKNADKKKSFFHKSFLLLSNIVTSLFGVILSPLKILLIPLKMSYLSSSKLRLARKSRKTRGYAAETFSDSFAISYGYGYETAKLFANDFIKNSTLDEQFLSKIPIIRIKKYYDELDNMFFNYYSDPHPTSKKRLENTLAKLKYELNNNKDLTKEQMADIKETISKVEALIDDAPLYVKAINKLFDKKDNERDKIGTGSLSNDQIFDAENTEEILGKNIKKESFEFNLDNEILNEEAYQALRYNKKLFKEKYILPENQDLFDLIYKKN